MKKLYRLYKFNLLAQWMVDDGNNRRAGMAGCVALLGHLRWVRGMHVCKNKVNGGWMSVDDDSPK